MRFKSGLNISQNQVILVNTSGAVRVQIPAEQLSLPLPGPELLLVHPASDLTNAGGRTLGHLRLLCLYAKLNLACDAVRTLW